MFLNRRFIATGAAITRAVFDAQGVGMSAVGVVSDTGTYDDQAYYDIREWPARVQDAISVWTGAEPDNPGEAITL